MLKKYRWILLLIILAAVLRVIVFLQIMNTTPHGDYFDYKEWIYKSYSLGFENLYTKKTKFAPINQPPGTVLILRGTYELFLQTAKVITHVTKQNAGATLWINDALLILFFRIPSMLADLFLGFCIYKLVRTKMKEKIALLASALLLLNPFAIYNSSVWGQLDSLNNVLFYLSLIFLIRKKAFTSVFFYALSLFVKLSLLPLLPLYLLFGFSGYFFKRKLFSLSLIASVGILLLISLPFSHNPFWLFPFLMNASGGENPGITAGAFNVWFVVFNPALRTNPPEVSNIFFGLTLGTWGYLLFTLSYLPLLFSAWKLIQTKKLTPDFIFLLSALAAFSAFLFLPKMHERYLYPAFPLLFTFVGLKNKYWITTIALSIVHFLNLYIIWNPNLFLFGPLENTITSQTSKWVLSLLTIIIFGFFYTKLYHYSRVSVTVKKGLRKI